MTSVGLTMSALPVGLFVAVVVATVIGHRVAVAGPPRVDAAPGIGAIDAGTRHQAFLNAHTPTAILALLVVVATCAAMVSGHDMGGRRTFSWLHAILFAGVVAVTIWVIYDLEMPRHGVIRVDDCDQAIRDVRAGFDQMR